MLALANSIFTRAQTPCLHVASECLSVIALYKNWGSRGGDRSGQFACFARYPQ